MRALLVALALLFVAPSCKEREECGGLYTVSADFSQEERAAIDRAARHWEAFSGRTVTLVEGDSPTCHIHPAAALSQHGVVLSGIERDKTGNIELSIHGEDPYFETVVTHEMGHGFGLEHLSSDPNAIMFSPAGGPEFTDADREECERVGVCVRSASEAPR